MSETKMSKDFAKGILAGILTTLAECQMTHDHKHISTCLSGWAATVREDADVDDDWMSSILSGTINHLLKGDRDELRRLAQSIIRIIETDDATKAHDGQNRCTGFIIDPSNN